MATDIIARGLAVKATKDLSNYQPLLESGVNIKTINGASVLGSGDLVVATNQAFKSGWRTNGTTKQFCDDVNADSSAIQGLSFIGEVTFSDLPASMVNAEITASIMAGTGTSNKVIHLVCTSGNVAPYRWEYTYWNNGSSVSGWVTVGTEVVANPAGSATSDLQKLQVGNTVYGIPSGAEVINVTYVTGTTINLPTGKGYSYIYDKLSNNTPVFINIKQKNLNSYTMFEMSCQFNAQLIVGNAFNFDSSTLNYTNIYVTPNDPQTLVLYPINKEIVKANDSLSGSEANLSELTVYGTKYKVPGGGHLYQHFITIANGAYTIFGYLTIYNTSNDAINNYSKLYSVWSGKTISMSTIRSSLDETYTGTIKFYKSYSITYDSLISVSYTEITYTNGVVTGLQNKSINDTGSTYNITDTVTQIL